MSRPRFLVASVTGYDTAGTRNGGPRTDYMVLDSANAHRVVGYFQAEPWERARGGHRKRKAQELAASLNAGDQEWRDALARDAELTA